MQIHSLGAVKAISKSGYDPEVIKPFSWGTNSNFASRYYCLSHFLPLLLQIADFGLLRHAAKDETMTVNIKGTPAYMAPEGPYSCEVRSCLGRLLEFYTVISMVTRWL